MRFYLTGPAPPEAFAALTAAFDVACLLVDPRRHDPAQWRETILLAQSRDIAVLFDGAIDLALDHGADGVHVDFSDMEAALKRLKPDFIVGVGGLETRHDAMVAGEAGVDYVSFAGSGAALEEMTSWWAEIFEIPCVAFADSVEMIPTLRRAGADFIALAPDMLAQADPVALSHESSS